MSDNKKTEIQLVYLYAIVYDIEKFYKDENAQKTS